MKTSIYLIAIIICLFSCSKEKISYNCTYCDYSKIFCVISDKSEILADGKSEIVISVCLPIEASQNIEEVIFEAPNGVATFLESNGLNSVTKKLDLNNEASVVLRIGTIPDTFQIKTRVSFNNVNYDEFITIKALPVNENVLDISYNRDMSVLVADNYSEFVSTVKVKNFNSQSKKLQCKISGPIKFVSSDLKQIEVPLSPTGSADVHFQTLDEAGKFYIEYQIDNFKINHSYELQLSYPSQMKLFSDKQFIELEDSLNVEVFLNKIGGGFISKQIPISIEGFQIIENQKQKVGFFYPPFPKTTSSETNLPNAKTMFVLPKESNIDSAAFIYIVATIGSISDSLKIKIKN